MDVTCSLVLPKEDPKSADVTRAAIAVGLRRCTDQKFACKLMHRCFVDAAKQENPKYTHKNFLVYMCMGKSSNQASFLEPFFSKNFF